MTMKDAKLNYVIETAASLFLSRSINSVTVKDIAKECGLGEATVYRYFSSKSELIVACAVYMGNKVKKLFTLDASKNGGYEKIERFFETYLHIFKTRPELYRFLNDFDAFCVAENVVNLKEYEESIDSFKSVFMEAFSEGLSDKSIKPTDDIETFYFTATHSLLSLCKKLSDNSAVISQDKLNNKEKEIKRLIDIILYYIKA
ncbi:MAG: TetR/AcrR family transcriptional regulator [Clostridia bacterium]|nr:TetR/AcrR family transcriptional regulator [Clostridia bacterium]